MMRLEDLHRALAPLRRRVQLMIGRAVIAVVDDNTKAQSVQITLLADEVHDGAERFQEYGFTSVPLAGAEAIVAFVGGLRSHGVIIAVEDRRYRLTGLQGGEVALYDDQGQAIILKRDRIRIESPFKVDCEAPHVVITSADVELGGEGGQPVARVGDTVSGGIITGGSDKVRAA